jgi:hypothetical protein
MTKWYSSRVGYDILESSSQSLLASIPFALPRAQASANEANATAETFKRLATLRDTQESDLESR